MAEDTQHQGQYFGPDKIAYVEELDYKTPQGNDVVKIHFDTDSGVDWEVTSKMTFENVVTEEPRDENYVQSQIVKQLAPAVSKMMMEYGISYGNVSFVLNRIGDHLKDKLQRASSFQWTGDDSHFVPGYNFVENINLLQIKKGLDEIDQSNAEKQETEE